jgi:hypothetical protein
MLAATASRARGSGPCGPSALATAAAVFALWPAAASAHAAQQAVILTLATTPAIIGAGFAVVITVLVGTLTGWVPRFGAIRIGSWPARGVVGSWAGFVVMLGALAVGVFGPHDPLGNLLTLTIWTVIWVLMTFIAALLGDIWRPVAPWRGPVRLVRRHLGRAGGIGLTRLGHWPAVLGLFGFIWFEIVSPAPADPLNLARVVALYWLAIFALAVLEGEEWLDRGELLTVHFSLISKIAPVWRSREGGRSVLHLGLPGAQIAAMAPLAAGEVAFVTLLLASVSFDGLNETFWWLGRIGVNPLDFPGRTAVMVPNTLGLIGAWALTSAAILGAVTLSRGARFGPMLLSFLPIATAYHVAHYLVSLLTQGQYVVTGLNDPFERGWSLLGISDEWASFGFLSNRADVMMIWSAQVAIIVAAHILAVLLALRLAKGGLRRHLPVSLLMVGYTVFGLWLLSTPAVG